jgi:polysaccharide export outer membrane protein
MKALRECLAVLAMVTALAGTAGAQTAAAKKPDKKPAETPAATSPAPVPAAKPATDDPDFLIGPEDGLRIDVWKEPELTLSVQVRPDGKISLPLLNDVQAAGLTSQGLAASITEKLKKYISEPQVTVIVQTILSRRFYIMGEVAKQGAFPMLHGLTVLQALAGAGSFSQFANTKKIYILRNHDGKREKIPFNYKEVIKGGHPEQDIELQPGDTIVVP